MSATGSADPPYAPATWRMLNTGLHDGPTNMAYDEAILESVADGESPPTLRFYGWLPPCLSLGFRQEWADVDQGLCEAQGWDIVRRPTGGRAILHVDELTYSVCAPIGEPRVQGSVLESYRRLSQALLTGLRLMGLAPVQAASSHANGVSAGPACFDVPSDYEITVNGRKLIGSAQVRKKQAVLQHGTLPLFGDVTRIVGGLRFDNEQQRAQAAAKLAQRASTVEQALGRPVPFVDAAKCLREGFGRALNLSFAEGDLSTKELNRAQELRSDKYVAYGWQQRV
jgi:lipoate-protein ligase A